MTSPLFIIGNPRSGTSLLRLMLTCHRRLCFPPECGFAMWLGERYAGWDRDCAGDMLEPFLSDLQATRKFETWRLDIARLGDFIEARRPGSYSELVSAVYACYAAQQGKPEARWGDKNNFYLHHIRGLKALFADACFIHVVRDPRDVACSYRELNRRQIHSRYRPRLPDSADAIAREWKRNMCAIRAAFDAFAWRQVFELRFDELVAEPRRRLEVLCRDLGEAFDPDMLAYPEANRAETLEPREFLQWKEKTLEPPRKDRIERFRSDLSGDDIRVIEAAAGDLMHVYGFEPA